MALILVGCVGAAGLLLFAATGGWRQVTVGRSVEFPDPTEWRTGEQLLPWLPAVAWAAMAAAGAVLAVRGLARVVVGLGIAVAGAVSVIGAVAVWSDGARIVWVAATVVAGATLVAAGVVTARHGRHWPTLGARYQRSPAGAPGARDGRAAEGPAETWAALDRGEDPTLD
ncbi:hypothetical protein GCM10010201_12190 [Pilimelia columellifera subsp. columellifera]|uniref:Uncharacterized protein n=2 Tax=Pilimelia TaxID=53370 RepID=A0ABP6AJG8_9ACTN